jgi:hypothetical protein
MAEYCEDGEAIIHATLCPGPEVFFELQNFTEVKTTILRKHRLSVALAGLASSAQVSRAAPANSRADIQTFHLLSADQESSEESYENEYVVSGTILACREIFNSVTEQRLIWTHLDAGKIRLEVLVNGRGVEGKPTVGSTLSATVWLQGHVLQDNELLARYEGIDMSTSKTEFWAMLKRAN